jgi:Rps23 Pro-64 3,4-dihydroxylase Tpa1-like proline 4-hydroxylase
VSDGAAVAPADDTLLDFNRLPRLAQALAAGYRNADPFPHVVIDDFIRPAAAQAIAAAVPPPDADRRWKQITDSYRDGDLSQAGKLGLPDEQQLSPLLRELLWEMNSAEFLDFLQDLTGVPGLIADPRFHGGGVHQTLPGGYLGIHADFTEHRYYGLSRRLNVLLYLNPAWEDAWGGHLELWRRDLSACVRRVRPTLGRCVIFNTDATSYHGHPEPLACPPGVTRKSIALYYYSNGREDETAAVTTTDWHKTSRRALPALE